MPPTPPAPRRRPDACLRLARGALAVVVGLALPALACGGAVAGPKRAFRDGRYADAQRALVACEAGRSQDAEYALTRGLVEHALGDLAAAARWLRVAREAERVAPGTFSEDDRTRLHLVLASLAAVDPATDPAE